jgi:hypothetical protein
MTEMAVPGKGHEDVGEGEQSGGAQDGGHGVPSGEVSEGDLETGGEEPVGFLERRLRLVVEPHHVGGLEGDASRERSHEGTLRVDPIVIGVVEVRQKLDALLDERFAGKSLFEGESTSPAVVFCWIRERPSWATRVVRGR